MTDWLLHTLLASSALILFVLVVREPVRTSFGSRIAYGLWMIPVARLFMPTLTHSIERTVASPRVVDLMARQSISMPHVSAPNSSMPDAAGGWTTILFVLWIGVAAGLFISRITAFHRDRRAILSSSLAITRVGAVRIIRTPEIQSPVALGILRPIIAVPSNFYSSYGTRERRLVLEHEFAHHRCGDLFANLFAFVLLCLQWFNPLAWVAHAAFRFDQEAACDSRVLDKASASDRASYGQAIAKAASGRALLFASALDRPTSLQRRLQSMLRSPTKVRRVLGRVLVVTAAAAALPLTASHAIAYVDVPAPAPRVAAVAPVPAAAPISVAIPAIAVHSAAQPLPPTPPIPPAAAEPVANPSGGHYHGDRTINDDRVTIDGKTKRWQELTPSEKAKVRAAVAKARAALANTHFDQAKMMRAVANVPDPARIAQMQRELADSQAKVAESLSRMREEEMEARASGQKGSEIEDAIRQSMQSLQGVDFQAAARSLASIDRQKIAAQVAGAQESMQRARAELDRMQARIDADQRH